MPGDHRAAKLRSYTTIIAPQEADHRPVGARLRRAIIAL